MTICTGFPVTITSTFDNLCKASEGGDVLSKLKPSVKTTTNVFLSTRRDSNAFSVKVKALPVAVTPPKNGSAKLIYLKLVRLSITRKIFG